MFSDFDENARKEEGRGRRTLSLILAGGIFVLLAAGVAAAVATAHQIARHEEEVDVEFAALDAAEPEPEPEPEPPPEPEPEPPQRRRPPPAAAVSDAPPTSIPDERPAESEGELAEAGEVGPVDGSPDGVEGGTGDAVVEEPVEPEPPEPPPGPPRPPRPPPQQERVEVQPPTLLSGCETPERPSTLEGQTAETIRIRVRVIVGADGRVLRATVTEGHELIPEETILECVNTRVFEPATLEGRPVPYVMTYVFTFRPDIL
jgi:hypothetical protein